MRHLTRSLFRSLGIALIVCATASLLHADRARVRRTTRQAPTERILRQGTAMTSTPERIHIQDTENGGMPLFTLTSPLAGQEDADAQRDSPYPTTRARHVGMRPGASALQERTDVTVPTRSDKPVSFAHSRERFTSGHRIPIADPDSTSRGVRRKENVFRVRPPTPSETPLIANTLPMRLTPVADEGEWLSYMYDSFEEEFPGYWILYGTPTWGRTQYRASHGNWSVWCARSHRHPRDGYVNNMNAWMIDGPFDLREATDALLYFDYFLDTEEEFDSLYVALSTDGENFYGTEYSGYSAGWVRDAVIDGYDFAGHQSVYVGINFYSDPVNSAFEGAYIDNIELLGFHAETYVDLGVSSVHIISADEGLFSFHIENNGATDVAADGYTVRVYVDDQLDSHGRNSYALPAGEYVVWDWQLAYDYPPGVYLVRIEVVPDDIELDDSDNSLTFTLVVGTTDPVDLVLSHARIQSARFGRFDFELYNKGPGTVDAQGYLIAVYVNGQLDSHARNAQPLPPHTAVVWDWILAYSYAPGTYTVTIEVTSVNDEINETDNILSFTLVVPERTIRTDLAVSRFRMIDELNAIFTFRVRNRGPDTAIPGTYAVRVAVDGEEDSYAANTQTLYPRSHALWDWQLQYAYPPGLRRVDVDVEVNGAELRPADNRLTFRYLEFGSGLSIVSPTMYTAPVGAEVSWVLDAQNGTPPYTWTTPRETLPEGLYLTGDGVLAGRIDAPGDYTFTVTCTDAHGDSARRTLTVEARTDITALDITSHVVPDAVTETAYIHELQAYGGELPYTWSAQGSMPPGLSLEPDGRILGTPTRAGKWRVPVQVRDAKGFTHMTDVHVKVRDIAYAIQPRNMRVRGVVRDHRRAQGETSPDRLVVRFDIAPPHALLLDEYTRVFARVGALAVADGIPHRARKDRRVVLRQQDGDMRQHIVVWKRPNGWVRVRIRLVNCDLVTALRDTGILDYMVFSVGDVPVQSMVDTSDTGVISVPISAQPRRRNTRIREL